MNVFNCLFATSKLFDGPIFSVYIKTMFESVTVEIYHTGFDILRGSIVINF